MSNKSHRPPLTRCATRDGLGGQGCSCGGTDHGGQPGSRAAGPQMGVGCLSRSTEAPRAGCPIRRPRPLWVPLWERACAAHPLTRLGEGSLSAAALAEAYPSPNRACRSVLHALSHKGRGRNNAHRRAEGTGADENDKGICSSILATHDARVMIINSALQVEGAGKAGHRLMPVARLQQKKQAAVTTGQPDDRPSLRDGLTAYTHSPRGPGCLAPVTGGSSSPPARPQRREARTMRLHRARPPFVRTTSAMLRRDTPTASPPRVS